MRQLRILLPLMAAMVVLSFDAKAQETDKTTGYERPYNQLLQGGFSFGYYGYGYAGTRTGFTLPLSATYETFVGDHISAGGFIGYSSYRYEGFSSYQYRWSRTTD